MEENNLKISLALYIRLEFSAFVFDSIFFILAGNEDTYKSLHEFEFGQNSAADVGVSCP